MNCQPKTYFLKTISCITICMLMLLSPCWAFANNLHFDLKTMLAPQIEINLLVIQKIFADAKASIPTNPENKMSKKERRFGSTGLKLYPLALGTLAFGREWPDGNEDYVPPSQQQVDALMLRAYETMSNSEGLLMVDTSRAYGYDEQDGDWLHGEKKIGEFFRKNPSFRNRTYIATKWGSNPDWCTNFTLERLNASVEQSAANLGRIDLLYIHYTSKSTADEFNILSDGSEIMQEMKKIRHSHYKGIQHLGITISNEEMLKTAVEKNLIKDFDVVQMYASVAIDNPELIKQLEDMGKAIVLNSPFRKGDSEKKETFLGRQEIIHEILEKTHTPVILTGTIDLKHLNENAGHVKSFFVKKHSNNLPVSKKRSGFPSLSMAINRIHDLQLLEQAI